VDNWFIETVEVLHKRKQLSDNQLGLLLRYPLMLLHENLKILSLTVLQHSAKRNVINFNRVIKLDYVWMIQLSVDLVLT